MKSFDVPSITRDRCAVFRSCDERGYGSTQGVRHLSGGPGGGVDCLTTAPFCVDIGMGGMIARCLFVGY